MIQKENNVFVNCPQKFRIRISNQNLEYLYLMKICKNSLECSLKEVEFILLPLWWACDFTWVIFVAEV